MCYAELAKLYPGTGSSYYFAEQSFLNHETAWKYARLSKFIVGWGSHLYYWIYPGVMVGVTGVVIGYLTGTLWPSFMSATNPGPIFMMLVAILFSFGVAWIAHRGVAGSTNVSIAINVIQITALLIFAVMAFSYRSSHPAGTPGWQFDSMSGDAYTYEFQTEKVRTATAALPTTSSATQTESPSRSWMRPASRCRSWWLIPKRTTRAISSAIRMPLPWLEYTIGDLPSCRRRSRS